MFNSAEWQPRVTQTVGVVKTDFLKKNPDLIRGIIQARRKGVEFIKANPDEAAAIMAKEYKIEPADAKAAIADILAVKGAYWSAGDFDYEGMEAMLRGLQLVKAIEPGPFDWSKVVDESYLPEDLRRSRRADADVIMVFPGSRSETRDLRTPCARKVRIAAARLPG